MAPAPAYIYDANEGLLPVNNLLTLHLCFLERALDDSCCCVYAWKWVSVEFSAEFFRFFCLLFPRLVSFSL